ncbi:STAS domain-containing protein [Ramlibacter sp.]|uniref:STAS domain-containing protein n=1 Tax=Ramlibacter sp. TaxID=1917967 RepID=UPI002D48EB53|nr:STAS domain-containing protein [Ramlibacter sp.]HYD76200.1 STAS domain-containing protein [Ramlibacter sp.]
MSDADMDAQPPAAAPVRLAWSGPVTIYEAVELRRQLLDALEAGRGLALDLGGVDEIDTAGIQLLVLAQREAHLAGQRSEVVAASAPVREALDLCGLGQLEAPAMPEQP